MGTRSQTSPGECLEACSPYSSCKDPNASDLGWDPWRGGQYSSGLSFGLLGVWEARTLGDGRSGKAVRV